MSENENIESREEDQIVVGVPVKQNKKILSKRRIFLLLLSIFLLEKIYPTSTSSSPNDTKTYKTTKARAAIINQNKTIFHLDLQKSTFLITSPLPTR